MPDSPPPPQPQLPARLPHDWQRHRGKWIVCSRCGISRNLAIAQTPCPLRRITKPAETPAHV